MFPHVLTANLLFNILNIVINVAFSLENNSVDHNFFGNTMKLCLN